MSIEEEEPLDPVLERVRRKMVRLLVVSIGIMMLGLMAVLVAVVYKITNPDGNSVASDVPVELKIPAGSTLVSTHMSEGKVLLVLKLADGSQRILVVDQSSGMVNRRFDLIEE